MVAGRGQGGSRGGAERVGRGRGQQGDTGGGAGRGVTWWGRGWGEE